MSMALCMVLLIGATFAWFTDSVNSGTNKIQAGNLDVAFEYSKDGGTNWTEVTKDTDDLFGKGYSVGAGPCGICEPQGLQLRFSGA